MTDDFLRSLTERADRAVPSIPVHTERVIPRARRRRTIIRGSQSLAVIAVLGVVIGGVGWAWQDRPAPPALPSPTASPSPTPSPTPSPEATGPAVSAPAPTQEATAPTPEAPPLQVTADLPFWHTVVETHFRDDPTVVSESWVAKNQDGLLITDGDQEGALGHFPLMVYLHDWLGLDPALDPDGYPQDEATLRAALTVAAADQDPSYREVTITAMAWHIVEAGGLLPESLRRAAWNLLLHSEATRVTPGSDITGRTGQVVHFTSSEDFTIVVDPDRLLLLQIGWHPDDVQVVTVHEAVATLPITAPDPRVMGSYGD